MSSYSQPNYGVQRSSITSNTWLTLKSAIFTVPVRVTKRLSGLMSPCTIFCCLKRRKAIKIQIVLIATHFQCNKKGR